MPSLFVYCIFDGKMMRDTICLEGNPVTSQDSFDNVLQRYKEQIDLVTLAVNSKGADTEAIERSMANLFVERDAIEVYLTDDNALSGDQIYQLNELDRTMFAIVRRAHTRRRANPGRYQYLYPTEDLKWWWRLDRIPNRRNNEIVYDDPLPVWIFAALIFFAISIGLVVLTTQQLWMQGLEVVGYFNLGFQLLVGGGLITERGQDTIVGMMSRIIRGFTSIFHFFRDGTPATFPLEIDTTSRNGLGIFSASVLFLIVTVTTAYIVIPVAAKWSHDQGVTALEAGDLESARQFLTLSIQLQPNTLPASVNPFAVNASPTLVQLGELYTEMGDFEQAQATYERALREDTLNVIVHYQLADLYIQQEETQRAVLLLDQGVRLLLSHLDGRTRLPLGSDNEATQLLFLTYTKRGKAQLANGNPQVALQDLSDAIGLTRMNPDLFIVPENMNNAPERALLATEMYYLRGRTWSQLIDDAPERCPNRLVDAARRDWQAVQTLGSGGTNSQSRLWLAEASTELNRFDEACRGNNN